LIGFTGHVNDPQTDLVYMQQRYYDPIAGRFLSVDPVMTDANTGASFNRFDYARQNPFGFNDPDGRDEEPVQKVFVPGQRPPPEPPPPDRFAVRSSTPTPETNFKVWPTLAALQDCASDQLGIDDLAAAGAVAAGWPIPGTKRFVTPGSSQGTSAAGMAADNIFGRARLPVRMPTIVGGPGTGRALSIAYTKSVARFAARAVPVVGWGVLAYDAVMIANCTFSGD
jgi:RHS repeat-associated protein